MFAVNIITGKHMQKMSTVHDAHLSLWQAAVAEVVDGDGAPNMQHPANAATIEVIESKDPTIRTTGSPATTDSSSDELDLVELSALHYQIAEADVTSDAVDRRLAEKLLAHNDRRDSEHGSIFKTAIGGFKILIGLLNKPVYRNWKKEGNGDVNYSVIDWRLPANARVALIADWGTGYSDAEDVLRAACALEPDAIIHLGDIYFAGTERECRRKFLEPIRRLAYRESDRAPLPVFNMAGNHDYYSGGSGFHMVIDELNSGDQRQQASYFCLRSADDGWQFLAMDTGHDARNDVARSHVMGAVPQPDEIEWLKHKLETFDGRTILLSHHQAFSNFDQMGGDPDDHEPPFDAVNRRLLATFEPYAGEIAAWFWGHEHHLMIFHPYKGLKGRCVGHGARPVSGSVIDRHTNYEFAYENVRLSLSDDGEHLNHGFEIIQIGAKGMPSEVSYYQVLSNGMPDLVFRELLE
jgi:3',5'-cyclic AMP phosphodiesterase CpdA